VSKRQKSLFAEPEPDPTSDGDIEYIGQKLPGDFADYILLEPEELAELGADEELFTLEDDPDPPGRIDHTVQDVQLAIRARDHLRFQAGDKVLCGIPLRMGPDGPNHWMYLTKVFELVGEEWRPASDCLIVRLLLPEEVRDHAAT
jgi:hypothetical protein